MGVDAAYPGLGQGRSAWSDPSMSRWLGWVYAMDHDQRQQERDWLKCRAMPIEERRQAWSRARGHLRVQGCWTDGDRNSSPDVDDWSPLFRRIVVWLK